VAVSFGRSNEPTGSIKCEGCFDYTRKLVTFQQGFCCVESVILFVCLFVCMLACLFFRFKYNTHLWLFNNFSSSYVNLRTTGSITKQFDTSQCFGSIKSAIKITIHI